jgi:hypothetical protein
VAFDGRESVQLLGVSSSALFRSGSVPNTRYIYIYTIQGVVVRIFESGRKLVTSFDIPLIESHSMLLSISQPLCRTEKRNLSEIRHQIYMHGRHRLALPHFSTL